MLHLRRKTDQTIHIGDDVIVRIVKTTKEGVQLAIDAPTAMSILRGELLEEQADLDRLSLPPRLFRMLRCAERLLPRRVYRRHFVPAFRDFVEDYLAEKAESRPGGTGFRWRAGVLLRGIAIVAGSVATSVPDRTWSLVFRAIALVAGLAALLAA